MLKHAGRHCVSLTTWFFQPELGMTKYEVLSRASACAVNLPSGSGRNDTRWTFLTSQHVTHPFRYPQYYAEPEHAFVHLLGEGDVRCTLEVRDPRSGAPLVVGHLERAVYGSPRRDVSVVRFPDGASQAAFLSAAAGVGAPVLPLALALVPPRETAGLTFDGHALTQVGSQVGVGEGAPPHARPPPGGDEEVSLGREDGDGCTLVPTTVRGRVLVRSGRQVFAQTDALLEMGMCGGPVLDEAGTCVGVVEGIVPVPGGGGVAAQQPPSSGLSDKARGVLGGAAVFVEVDELRVLLEEVEKRDAVLQRHTQRMQ